MTYITGCSNPRALTILIRGSSYHVMDEIERALKDALGDVASILGDSLVVAGGGAVEVELSKELKSFSQTLSGREQLAVEEFAKDWKLLLCSVTQVFVFKLRVRSLQHLTLLRLKTPAKPVNIRMKKKLYFNRIKYIHLYSGS